MITGNDQPHLFFHQDRLDNIGATHSRADHTDFQHSCLDINKYFFRITHPQRNTHIRIALAKRADKPRQQIITGDRAAADHQLASNSTVKIRHRCFQFFGQRCQPLGVTIKQFTSLGRNSLPVYPVKHFASVMGFQVFDVGTDCRLGQVNYPGGFGKTFVINHLAKNHQTPQVHISLPFSKKTGFPNFLISFDGLKNKGLTCNVIIADLAEYILYEYKKLFFSIFIHFLSAGKYRIVSIKMIHILFV